MHKQPRAYTILVADDSDDAAESLAMLLEFEGHTVVTARDGAAALAEAERVRPQIAIVDIGMPLMDGHEVARALRAQPWARTMLLIAATGWSQEQDRLRALESGFDRHLPKPMDATALVDSLSEWADEVRTRRG